MSTFVLQAKDVDEIDVLRFSFADALLDGESISAAEVSCERVGGEADPTPAAMLLGLPSIDAQNLEVLQRVQGGVDGAVYRLRCKATLAGGNGRRLVLSAQLPVQRW